MATTVVGSAMASCGFVLKSVRTGTLTTTAETFSVQNEGGFCIIANDFGGDNSFKFYVNQIDDIPAGFETRQSSLVFGKNIVVRAGNYNFTYHIYEYGPA